MMRNRYSRHTLPLVVVALIACDEGQRPQLVDSVAGRLDSVPPIHNVAMVRLVNAVPDLENVSVTSENRSVFSGVNFRDVTQYQEVEQILARFRLLAGKRDTTLDTNMEILLDGSRYTLIALPGGDGGVNLRVLRDEFTPDSGLARVRVIHAVPNVESVDVAMRGEGEPIFDDIAFGLEAGFQDIAPGESEFLVRNSEGNRQLLRHMVKLEAGHAYTIVLTGAANGDVEAITIDDRARPGK